MRKMLLSFVLFYSCLSHAAVVDTVSIYSQAMHTAFKCVVITPAAYENNTRSFPTVYLLHGYSGAFDNWIKKMPELKGAADQMNIIIVCPDGGYSGWYFDSPVDSSFRYETYIAREVPAYIDAHYRTIKDRKARAIAGLSMGGHGALFLAFRHAETFGACGSMSGVVDLAVAHNKYDLMKRIGDTIKQADNWKKYSVINVIEQYPKDSLAIILDCGNSDSFAEVNKQLHEKMMALKIPHDYIARPGKHEWPYWRNAVQYQLLFFENYFRTNGQLAMGNGQLAILS